MRSVGSGSVAVLCAAALAWAWVTPAAADPLPKPAGSLQGGVHLRGSYPSDAAGSPAVDGTVNPTSWSGIVATGGQPAPNTTAHAFAVCAGHHVGSDE
ncbi:hypothetical protein [Frankia sp. CiP1_Cm_nod1]|uniref:hypothetical protein n=1 Tax=Frankia sp. CiP1_Cm_nod1 TaxID=2897160 RepID=UPI002024779C